MAEENKQEKRIVPNPSGKGGFGDNPQNRNSGRWKKENSFSYQMNRFKNMTIQELNEWSKNTPEDKRTVAEDLAFRRIYNAREDLNEFREVADRTEGKATQPIDFDGEMTVKDISNKDLAKTIRDIITKDDRPDKNTSDTATDTQQVQE